MVTQRCWSPRKTRKTKWNQNSSGKYYAFPPKTHDTKNGAQVKRSNVQTELTWPRVSTQLRHRVPPFHTTNQTRGYELQRLGRLHRTNRTVIVSTDERACCLECCQSDDPRACSETRAIEPKTTIQISMIAPPSRVIWQVAAQLLRPCLKIENCGGSFPMKGIQLFYQLYKNQWRK